MHALVRGELDAAERAIDETRALGRRSAPQQAEIAYLLQIAQLRREQHRAAEVLALASDIAERHPAGSHYNCVHTGLLADAGHLAEAQAAFCRLAADGFSGVSHDLLWLPSLATLAGICERAGTNEHAAQLQQLLLPYADRNVSGGGNFTCLGPVALSLGTLATQQQQWDAAEAHYRAALDLATRMQSPLFIAESQTGIARALAQRGDTQPAQQLLVAALETSETYGLERVAALATDVRQAMQ
jgi:uncharacterized protein HemY